MVLMRTYCFYLSVRLGVILASVLVIVQLSANLTLFHLFGRSWLERLREIIDTDEGDYEVLVEFLTFLIESEYIFCGSTVNKYFLYLYLSSGDFLTVLSIVVSLELLLSLMAIYGAYKLEKWMIIPFIILEFIRFVVVLISHVILMLILKEVINLGELIAATLAGSCLICKY